MPLLLGDVADRQHPGDGAEQQDQLEHPHIGDMEKIPGHHFVHRDDREDEIELADGPTRKGRKSVYRLQQGIHG